MTQPGHDLIRAERFRQEAAEGFHRRDDIGREAELLAAAECYADLARAQVLGFNPLALDASIPPLWPWAPDTWHPSQDPRRNAVKAGALVAAAIDAMQGDLVATPDPAVGFQRGPTLEGEQVLTREEPQQGIDL